MSLRSSGAPTPGLASPPILDYLVDLGVTSIELLPVHQFLSEHFLHRRGLRNYWGYNSIAYLAPHGRYSSAGDCGEQVAEFKSMVSALHAAGLEVILDVVYNHTAEGNHLGPTLSLKGFDNPAYYRLDAQDGAGTSTSRAPATASTCATRSRCSC